MDDITKRPPWRPTKYRPEFCQVAIDVLSSGRSYAALAAELGVGKASIYDWEKKHQGFSTALKIGLAKAEMIWEEQRPAEVPPAVWIFTMKNRFGWQDKHETAITGKDGGPLVVRWMTETEGRRDG